MESVCVCVCAVIVVMAQSAFSIKIAGFTLSFSVIKKWTSTTKLEQTERAKKQAVTFLTFLSACVTHRVSCESCVMLAAQLQVHYCDIDVSSSVSKNQQYVQDVPTIFFSIFSAFYDQFYQICDMDQSNMKE